MTYWAQWAALLSLLGLCVEDLIVCFWDYRYGMVAMWRIALKAFSLVTAPVLFWSTGAFALLPLIGSN